MSRTDPSNDRFVVVIGGGRGGRVNEWLRERRGAVHALRPSAWPFTRDLFADLPAERPLTLRAPDLDEAFPAAQTGGTRLVLTQSTYVLQKWIDWLEAAGDVRLIADADAGALRARAAEAFASRGPWSRIPLMASEPLAGPEHDARDPSDRPEPRERLDLLSTAFIVPDPDHRLALCRRAHDQAPDDVAVLLALGSALMEVQDLEAARATLERALALAPDWEAAHFELGKLHLRADDMEAASRAFAEAGRLMPTFAAAFSNLGATLGELDRTDEALSAFRQALRHDPNGHTILNNIGVVSRESGRLDESEAALRRVTNLAPDFVFGHYNLGHTLFLQGRYQAALAAYEEGQRRDPEKNARQASRLAVTRLAAGDADGSLRDFQRYTAHLPAEQKREILGEAQEILWALLADRPELPGWRRVADAVKAELDRI